MVESLNKWLFVLMVPGFLVFVKEETPANSRTTEREDVPHPLHISTTEINHNAAEKSLEITCRIFTDDFETCLSRQFHTKADLSAPALKSSMDSLVKKYVMARLRINTGGKTLSPVYLGFEKDGDAINSYFECDNIGVVRKAGITNTILHDLYTDQVNIIHMVVGGVRKSTKLDYPAKIVEFSF